MTEDAHPTSPQPTVNINEAVSATAVANLTLNNNNPLDPSLEFFHWNYPDFPKPAIRTELPQNLERIEKSEQLVYWCSLLLQRASSSPSLVEAERKWLEGMDKDSMEQDRLRWIATRMVEEFVPNAASRSSVEIAEVVSLGPILERESYRKLLSSLIAEFDDALLLDITLLQGLVQLVQSNSPGYLEADDLIKILSILRVRLQGTHGQSSEYSYQLVLAVSCVLDVMAEHEVKGLDRVVEHEPLSGVLSTLKGSSDPYMLYQACYAFQALQYVPDNESPLQAVLRHSAGVAKGLIDITALAKLDLGAILEGLTSFQSASVGDTIDTAKTVYGGASSLMESGRYVLEALKEKYGTGKKQPWYAAIRAAHALAQAGQMKDFNRFICEAPCRRDPLFQWGISQMLLEMTSDAAWDHDTQEHVRCLLLGLCTRDPDWNRDESLRTYLFRNTEQLSNPDGEVFNGDKSGIRYPMRNRLPPPTSSPLLARVLDIPDVEHDLQGLKMQRLGERRKG
ncbi:hypothetical protein BGZ90_004409, partial [Linnemannia elongata]